MTRAVLKRTEFVNLLQDRIWTLLFIIIIKLIHHSRKSTLNLRKLGHMVKENVAVLNIEK